MRWWWTCVLLAGFLLAGVAGEAQAGHGRRGRRAVLGDEPQIPKWSVQVRTFAAAGSPAAAVYRRLAKRWDLGLQVGGELYSHSLESELEEHLEDLSTHEDVEWTHDGFAVDLHAELRRWKRHSRTLATYYGLRLSLGYADGEAEGDSLHVGERVSSQTIERRRYRVTAESVGTGFALVAGVRLALMRHLSLCAALTPVQVGTIWDLDRGREGGAADDQALEGTRTSERSYWIGFSLEPTLYLVLAF